MADYVRSFLNIVEAALSEFDFCNADAIDLVDADNEKEIIWHLCAPKLSHQNSQTLCSR